MLKIITLALAVWTFFNPYYGGIAYLAFTIGLAIVMMAITRSRDVAPAELELSKDEREVYADYNVWFRYPSVSQQISRTFSLIQLVSMVLMVWFLIRGEYILAGIAVIDYYVAGIPSVRLNPPLFLAKGMQKGNRRAARELVQIEAITTSIQHLQNLKSGVYDREIQKIKTEMRERSQQHTHSN